MTLPTLHDQIRLGEDSSRQFKADLRNAESLAAEMVAFSNSSGGMLYIGVADDGTMAGLSAPDVARINQLISNTASQLVRSPITVQTENIALENGRIVIVLKVPSGSDKPYFDKNGVIWLKTGADKRRVNSKEELRRFFQISDQFHADELPTKAGLDKLDKLRFRDFLRDTYKQALPESSAEQTRLLQNMNLATDDGHLNLAGVLMFAERPEWIVPQFVVKAIRYPGNQIHVSEYIDTEDFSGPLPKIFNDALAFVMRNLHKTQAGRGVNAPGQPEISESVFEELLVNALVHRDYLVSAPIRLFIFDTVASKCSSKYVDLGSRNTLMQCLLPATKVATQNEHQFGGAYTACSFQFEQMARNQFSMISLPFSPCSGGSRPSTTSWLPARPIGLTTPDTSLHKPGSCNPPFKSRPPKFCRYPPAPSLPRPGVRTTHA
jgi:ATP-dependent DNA helicase RecG